MSFICKKSKKPATPLKKAPITGPFGQWILENIGQESWQIWQEEQTKLINENRLDPTVKEDKIIIRNAMKAFFNHSE